jgi:hypothetical protein
MDAQASETHINSGSLVKIKVTERRSLNGQDRTVWGRIYVEYMYSVDGRE